MKILQTPVRFHPFIGGVENYVYNLSRGLVGLGHEVTVLCANESKLEKEELLDGIKVRRLPYACKIANTNITPSLPIEILREEFDLIHAHLPTPWSADWSALAAAAKRRPMVLTYYNDIVGEGAAERIAQLYNRFNLKFVLKKASRVIIIQPDYINTSLHLRHYEKKVVAIPVGVDLERFRPLGTGADGKTLFFLSVLDRFHRYKGLDILLLALSAVKKEVPDVKLIVGGEGDLLEHYQRLSDGLGLAENVEFPGRVPEEMVADYYNRCDIFVLPSISGAQEGFGMVALEAMACAKPVICSTIVGVAEEVKAEGAGLTVEPSNAKELSKAILRLLQNRSEAISMGGVGRRLAQERYNWKTVAKRVEEVYEELI
ncbi:MAG: glycosyltransferase family 4 protein [Methanothrix sp.]